MFKLIVIIVGLFSLVSCKEKESDPEKGKLNSIDALLQNKEVKDRSARCGPLSKDLEDLFSKPEFQAAWNRDFSLSVTAPMTEEDARRLLVTIPNFVYDHVIKSAKIAFVGNAEELCTQKLKAIGHWTKNSSSQLADLRACWYQEPNQPMNLVLPADWTTASRGVLPLVGYAFMGSFDGRKIRAAADSGSLTAEQANTAFAARNQFKIELATLGRAIIADINASDIDEAEKKALVEKYTSQFRLAGDSERRFREFGEIVFAESFDSYYCSSASMTTFKAPEGAFNKTWQAFKPFASVLGKTWMDRTGL